MDAFSLAEAELGGVSLGPGQLAELRAINHEYWRRVHELVSAPGAGPADRPLTAAETTELRAMVVARLEAMLTPEQRAARQRRR
ncbi:MAG TPA: hypothetical protein VKA84_02695 [Gemmatimonadaceae bacterium]|nr:hypothetical protein [Gemmatimonadaceae bacterium]